MDTKYCDFDIGTPCASADIMQRHIAAEHIDARQRAQSADTREAEKKSGILRLRAIYHCGKQGACACVTQNHREPPLRDRSITAKSTSQKKVGDFEPKSRGETFVIVMVSSRVQFKQAKFSPSMINVLDLSAL